MTFDPDLYPVSLVLAGRPCLVVGGGPVAARKIAALLRAGAPVTVVAPEAHRALAVLAADGLFTTPGLPPLTVHLRPYEPGEVAAYRLVVTATGRVDIDAAVHADAEAAGIWVNAADDLDHSSFVLPAVARAGPVSVAVSTGGASPALAAWLRNRLAAVLGPGLGSLAALLADARADLHARGISTETVDWAALLDGPLPTLVDAGDLDAARALLATAVDNAVAGRSGHST